MPISETIFFDWKKRVSIALTIVVLFIASYITTGASFIELFSNTGQMGAFLKRFLQPDFAYIPKLIAPLFATLTMSLVGTFIGALAALPFAFLATSVVIKNEWVANFFRFILSLIRTVPMLLLAALLVALLGIGEFTGVVTIAIFTFGVVSQLIYESIETIDFLVVEAHEAVGATKPQVALFAVLPQIIMQVVSYSLYAFEINVRSSTVLGYVGAGGIGLILNSSLALLRYDRVSIVILVILLTVVIVDSISEYLRKRLS